MKIEEVVKVLDLVFYEMDEDPINYDFLEEDYLDDNIGCLEIKLRR